MFGQTALSAVYLCCTFPEVAFGGRYPLSLPCGARTFLTDGLSAWPRDCLSYSRPLLYRKKPELSTPGAKKRKSGQPLSAGCNFSETAV